MNKEFDIKDNKIMLLEEDSWCVHKYLDDINIPRNNGDGKQYSIVGRIKILQENYLEQMSNLETMYLSKDSKISQQETLYTEEQVRKLIEEANYDGQSLHAKSVTRQMMRDNAESYSNEIIQSFKQDNKN